MMQTAITMKVALNGTVTGQISGFEFGALVHMEPSINGINQGRICRLSVANGYGNILCYDHSWQVPVPDSFKGVFVQLVKALEELPV